MEDYAEAEWNRQLDECVRQLQDAQHLSERITSELSRLQGLCDRTRSEVRNFEGMERYDVEVIARLLRDSFGQEIGQVIRTLNAAYDETLSADRVLDRSWP